MLRLYSLGSTRNRSEFCSPCSCSPPRSAQVAQNASAPELSPEQVLARGQEVERALTTVRAGTVPVLVDDTRAAPEQTSLVQLLASGLDHTHPDSIV